MSIANDPGLRRGDIIRWVIGFVLMFGALAGFAQGLQPIPPLTALAIDQTGTLDPIQLKGLDDKLKDFERDKGTQIAVLVVPTTQPEDDASYANRVGNAWKIGRKGVGDGVLVVVAKNDRKIRIEVAKSLEGAIPDLAAQQVIDEAIRPRFRADDYAGGLQAGVDQLIARINGEALPAPKARPQARDVHGLAGFDWMDLAIFAFFAVPIGGAILRGIFGRKLGALFTGAGVGTLALLITSSLLIAAIAAFIALVYSLVAGGFGGVSPRRSSRGGWGGGPWVGGGGFGGGGSGWSGGGGSSWGGSGGGGDFGGGGASGDW